ncbi:uncharacterized protein LOC124897251 [Capsicum annuum]|uniref:uncharacterized protein LOC124897251 n=1 Tax=Capsicum annuum TaxID=4072 RepID=UPI001FB167A1|nr:uncharacterized protein LOC124897251 [Capsicum annuum]
MTKSYSKTEFHNLMEKGETFDVRVKNYLKLAGYDKWARSYASIHRGWTLTSNIAESIDAALQQALYSFTDLIGKFQQILQQNKAECTRMKENTYAEMVKYICKTVSDITLQKNTYAEMVIPSSEYIYTVHDKEKHFIICLKEKHVLAMHFS